MSFVPSNPSDDATGMIRILDVCWLRTVWKWFSERLVNWKTRVINKVIVPLCLYSSIHLIPGPFMNHQASTLAVNFPFLLPSMKDNKKYSALQIQVMSQTSSSRSQGLRKCQGARHQSSFLSHPNDFPFGGETEFNKHISSNWMHFIRQLLELFY